MDFKQKNLFPEEDFFKYEKPQPVDVPKKPDVADKPAEQFLTDEEYFNRLYPGVARCLDSGDYAADTPGFYRQVLKEAGFQPSEKEFNLFVQKIRVISSQIISRRNKQNK